MILPKSVQQIDQLDHTAVPFRFELVENRTSAVHGHTSQHLALVKINGAENVLAFLVHLIYIGYLTLTPAASMEQEQGHNLPQQDNYQRALADAKESLSRLDFDLQCKNAGEEPDESGATLRFIDRLFLIHRDTFEIEAADKGPPPETWEKIVALHYLIKADGKAPTGELITYKQVKDGAPYFPVFNKRTAGILLSVFRDRPEELATAAGKIGADEVSGHGDTAFKVKALPRVEYVFVVCLADHEFPMDIRVLFDSSVTGYLPAEDITVLCQMVCIKIVKQAG